MCICLQRLIADYSDHTIYHYSPLLSLSCVLFSTVLHFGGCTILSFLPTQISLPLNLLFPKVHVRHTGLCVHSRTCMVMGLPCVNMPYWLRPTEVASPQLWSVRTMGSQSCKHRISQEPPDWLLPRSRLPWWQISSKLRLCLHQWWDGASAISLLLRAIDSIRQGRLQHLYSKKKEEKWGMESSGRTKNVRKRETEGMGWGQRGEWKKKIEYWEKKLESVSAGGETERI